MPENRKSLMFSVFFTAGLILLLLLGETFASYWVFGGMALWMVLFRPEGTVTKPLFWFPVVFLLLAGASTILSVHLPLSLFAVAFFCLAISVFWLIISSSKKTLPTKEILYGILMAGGYVTAVSWVVRFWPDLAELVQGMNLLLPTYGHNHLASLLLLMLPLAWWRLLGKRQVKHRLRVDRLLLLLFLFFSLLVSFGRVALFLGLLQLVVIGWLTLKERTSHHRLRDVLIVAGLIFLGVIGLQTLFSLPRSLIACPVDNLESKLCKPIDREVRPFYWRQAGEVIKENPWFGAGPGTFGLVARKHQELPYLNSSFTHNAFLQQFAELGWLGGGVFLAWMLYVLKIAWHSVAKEFTAPGFTWKKAVMLSIGSSYLNALVDFDWSFIGIFVVTLVLMGLLVRERGIDDQKIGKQLFDVARLFLLVGLLVMAGLYGWTEGLLKMNLTDRAAAFPYFHFQRKAFQTGQLSEENSQKLEWLYRYDLGFYRHQLQQADIEERVYYQEKLVEIDPWERLNYGLLAVYLEAGRWSAAEAEAQAIADLVEGGRRHGYQFEYDQRKAFAKETIRLGNHYFNEENFAAAGRMYALAQSFDEWALAAGKPVFVEVPTDEVLPQTIFFFDQLKSIEAKYFGFYRDQYAEYYLVSALANQESGDSGLLADAARTIVRLNSWLHWAVERQLNTVLLGRVEVLIETEQYEEAQQHLAELVTIWQFYQENQLETTFVIDQRLVMASLQLAEELPDAAEENTAQAIEIIPWAEEMYLTEFSR